MAEGERLRKRIAELEQVVRELRQKNPSRSHAPAMSSTPAQQIPTTAATTSQSITTNTSPDRGQDNKKRRVIIDRFARFKLGEAALAEVAAAASRERSPQPPDAGGTSATTAPSTGDGNQDYKSEPYRMYMNPGEEMVRDSVGRKTFLGAPAGASMLRRLRELTSAKQSQTIGVGQGHGQGEDELLSFNENNAYGIVFPDMRKTFPFTTIWSHENFSGEIIGLLPNREQAEILLTAWKEEVVTIILGYHVYVSEPV